MRILICDDEKNIRFTLTNILTDEGYEVVCVDSGEKALSKLEDQCFELIILDVKLPGMNGIEVFRNIKKMGIDTNVLVISGHSGIETAVEAVKLGAYDFLEKPLSMAKILTALRNIEERQDLKNKVAHVDINTANKYQMIGNSPEILAMREIIERVAPMDTKVLIRGDSGTGKELVAWAIHQSSKRRDQAFIAFNSAALPSELVESELFGYEKGAFTGAEKRKLGKLELANKGSLFLDEIGDMSMETQAKVLRVIQEGTFERVGGQRTIDIDVRIMAATHKDLESMIQNGTFREDLFYRLNVLPINVPLLRDRQGDVIVLADYFLQHFSVELKMARKTLAAGAQDLLTSYSFPGNVREMRNLIERLYILVREDEIQERDILPHIRTSLSGTEQSHLMRTKNFSEAKREFEVEYLTRQLEQSSWNINAVAEKLGMLQPNLSRKLKELGIRK